MAKTYTEIKAEIASDITGKTEAKSITKTAVGGAIADVLDVLGDKAQTNVYTSSDDSGIMWMSSKNKIAATSANYFGRVQKLEKGMKYNFSCKTKTFSEEPSVGMTDFVGSHSANEDFIPTDGENWAITFYTAVANSITITIYGFGLEDEFNKHISNQSNIGLNTIRECPYIFHYFRDMRSGTDADVHCPSESIHAVTLARRFGFKAMILSCQKTSDGKYVVFHGTNGCIDSQFNLVSNPSGSFSGKTQTDIEDATISVNSVTLADIQSNLVYKCANPKWRTAPSELSVMLKCLKKNGIMPIFTANADTIAIANDVMGKDNYIAYINSPDVTKAKEIRALTDAVIYSYYSGSDLTLDSIKAYCSSVRSPLMYGISDWSAYTSTFMQNMAHYLHSNNNIAMLAMMNVTPYTEYHAMNRELDSIVTIYNVNEFKGNLISLLSNNTFDGLSHNGSVSNGILTLAQGNTLTLNSDNQSKLTTCEYAKISLRIKMSGSLSVTMGDISNYTITPPNGDEIRISTKVVNKIPNFTLTSVSDTTIDYIEVEISKV